MKLVERKEVYKGKLVDLIADTVEIKGREYIREVVRHPGGVVVVVELEGGRIPFVRQLRYPMDEVMLELPAGKRDEGENPEVSAARELEEETGLRPEFLEHIFSFYPTPGFCDELLHLYYTNRVKETANNLGHDEDLVVEFYTLDEAIDMAVKGEIIDGKTLLALFWLKWKKSFPSC